MAKVSFFTPINFGNQPKSTTEWLLEKADGFFYLGGPKAHIIKTDKGAKAVLVDEEQSFGMTCLKVMCHFSIFQPALSFSLDPTLFTHLIKRTRGAILLPSLLPVALLVTKVVLRCIHSYEIEEEPIDPSVIEKPGPNLDEKKVTVDTSKIDDPSIKPLAHQLIDPSVIDTLGLDLDEEATVDGSKFKPIVISYIPKEPFTLRQAVRDVITKINEAIQRKSIANPQASEEDKHLILLSTAAPWDETNGSDLHFYDGYCGEQEQDNNFWLKRILQALVDKNHIQLIGTRVNGYIIQT